MTIENETPHLDSLIIAQPNRLALASKQDRILNFDLDQWYRHLKSPLSRKQYGRYALQFLKWLWEQAPGQQEWPGYAPYALVGAIGKRSVLEYLLERRDEPYTFRRFYPTKGWVEITTKGGVGDSAYNGMRAALRSLARWLKDSGHITQEALAGILEIKAMPSEATWQEPVPADTMLAVLETITPSNRKASSNEFWDELHAQRDDMIFRFMWACGARIGEACNLKVGDFRYAPREDPTDFSFRFLCKRGKWKTWKVHPEVGKRMLAWLEAAELIGHPNWPAFPALSWQGALKFGKWHRKVGEAKTMDEKRDIPRIPNALSPSVMAHQVFGRRFVEAGYGDQKTDKKGNVHYYPDYTSHGIRAGACCAGLYERLSRTGMIDIAWARAFLGHANFSSLDHYIRHVYEHMVDVELPAILALGLADADGFNGNGQ